jgi:hypothetical protein
MENTYFNQLSLDEHTHIDVANILRNNASISVAPTGYYTHWDLHKEPIVQHTPEEIIREIATVFEFDLECKQYSSKRYTGKAYRKLDRDTEHDGINYTDSNFLFMFTDLEQCDMFKVARPGNNGFLDFGGDILEFDLKDELVITGSSHNNEDSQILVSGGSFIKNGAYYTRLEYADYSDYI